METGVPPVDIELGIVAHTSRQQQARQLARAIGANYISTDDGRLGCRGNHVAVWRHLAGLRSEWSVVIEDDAQPVPDFTNQLHQALSAAQTPIVSLYLGRSRPASWQARIQHATTQADKHDACWIKGPLLHAVAVAIRTNLITDMLTHLAPNKPIDNAVSQWARSHDHTSTWPSLVDHQDNTSLVTHNYNPATQTRRAWRTGSRDTWHNTTVTL